MLKRIVGITFFCLLLLGCAANRAVVTPYDKVKLIATEDVNPDVEGDPSPIAVRIYQLTARSTFDNLDFDAAFHNADVLLSDQLRSKAEHVVQPGETILHRMELDRDTRYIAVVAAYRAIDGAKWKLVYPLNSDWYYTHQVQLGAHEVVLLDD